MNKVPMPKEHGVKFICVDCKAEIDLARNRACPVPPRCAKCQWIAAEIDPSDYAKMRDALGVKVPE